MTGESKWCMVWLEVNTLSVRFITWYFAQYVNPWIVNPWIVNAWIVNEWIVNQWIVNAWNVNLWISGSGNREWVNQSIIIHCTTQCKNQWAGNSLINDLRMNELGLSFSLQASIDYTWLKAWISESMNCASLHYQRMNQWFFTAGISVCWNHRFLNSWMMKVGRNENIMDYS